MKYWNDGDIIKTASYGGGESYRVIVKVYSRYVLMLRLYEEAWEWNFSANVDGKELLCDVGRLSHKTRADLDDAVLIRTMTDDEYTAMMEKVGDVLGTPISLEPTEDFQKQFNEVQNRNAVLVGCNEELNKNLQASNAEKEELAKKLAEAMKTQPLTVMPPEPVDIEMKVEMAKIAAERDVYKKMCTQLIAKITEAGK